MSAFLMNGLLMLGFVVAIMRDTMALGFSGPTLVMDQDIPSRICKYSRGYSMIQVHCKNLGLEWIPPNLKTEIQVRRVKAWSFHIIRKIVISDSDSPCVTSYFESYI